MRYLRAPMMIFASAWHPLAASAVRVMNADTEAWAPRIAKGMDTLMASTLNGLGMMPAKGTCMNCSDDELQAAVDYIVETAQ